MKRSPFLLGAFAALALMASPARAGEFDARGEYRPSRDAVVHQGFAGSPQRYLPEDAEAKCKDEMFEPVTGDDSALDGSEYLRLRVDLECAERFSFTLPPEKASYRASVWMRHGGIDANIIVLYQDEANRGLSTARMAPTGRTTSDGWVELATNDFPVDGALVRAAYLKVTNFADQDGVDLDSLEIVPSGVYVAPRACTGVADPTCSDEEVCIQNQCVLGRSFVPPLPDDAARNAVVDALQAKLRIFYGGRRSRSIYLPDALAALEQMRSAKTAWAFWNTWATGISKLHDWHTSPRGGPAANGGARRLNACFFEGDADRSHKAWPKDAKYNDVLVSHVGQGAAGLKAGDRLVAVDGLHPFQWVDSLIGKHWGYHAATDPDNFADHAEALGGPIWSGALIVRYATNITVIRCDAASDTCSDVPETIAIADLPSGGEGPDVACDNRPFYHLEDGKNPNADNHYVFGNFFRGRIAESNPEEAIYGMVWDTLYGGGDPNGWVNKNLKDAINDWKANARGVILDHRAGNGGTMDAPELLTGLVRPKDVAAVIRMPMEIAAWDGPADLDEGLAIFNNFKKVSPYDVGAAGHDPDLPVALILHRDGSASDYLPLGMKGAPKTRIFGPHATAGAFSTYIEFNYWGGLGFQLASGDTIASDGRALIGHGLVPDEVVLPKQSDLLAGKDTLFEAALAWVRKELKQ